MGSSMSTHAKAASAPSTDSSIMKGSNDKNKKQQVGVSGHMSTYNNNNSNSNSNNANDNKTKKKSLDQNGSSTANASGAGSELLKSEAIEKKYVVVVEERGPFDVEDESTAETEVDSHEDDQSEAEYDSDDDSDDEDHEYDEETSRILEDARKLKVLAQAFLHPEQPIKTDPTSFGRNYYTRPSAPPTESLEEANERAAILQDAYQLKKCANQYLHPEIPVVQTQEEVMFTSARNFFTRNDNNNDDDEQETFEEAEERARILEDAQNLKKLAVDYLHPEIGVGKQQQQQQQDGTQFGRNYFTRPSAQDMVVETLEESEERAQIMADIQALKKAAKDYLHPELGVVPNVDVDPTTFGRNYFNRYSAVETEEDEYADERAEILEEMAALKKHAVAYMHPEIGVKSTDPTVFGRNYFDRPSAPEMEDEEFANERAEILKDMAALKKQAVAYMHPEVGVKTTDATVFGRNYFNRPSAPEIEDDEYADERVDILEEMAELKKYAQAYMHPEIGVKTTDPTAFGRNYFNRPSAPEVEDKEIADERARILADAAALKKHAVEYMHPEVGVENTDPIDYGRNFFNRASAPEMEDADLANERARILADAAALKKQAINYMHPEVGVNTTDPTVYGRNYFNRPSGPEVESKDQEEGRSRVLAEASLLKKHAVDYMHPEMGVKTSDSTAYARNYFGPDANAIYTEAVVVPSSSSYDDDDEEAAHNSEVEESHGSMFELEDDHDDDFSMLRHSLQAFIPINPHDSSSSNNKNKESSSKNEDENLKEDEEGNLSRSPSSVMLFGLVEGNA